MPAAAPKAPSTTGSCRLGRVAVPAGTAPYWCDLLHRCGLEVHGELAGPVAFIPPELPVDAHTAARLREGGTGLVGAVAAGPGAIPLRLPPATRLLAARPALQEFGAGGGVSVAEVVAGTDHGAVRRLVLDALRRAHFAAGLPLVRLDVAPAGYSGTFALRIDADDYAPPSTAAVVAGLERARLRATWFIDVERHERKGGADAVRQLLAAGHEVQSHFYHHYTYGSAERNLRNLCRSRAVLRSWGVDVDAAAAPFGTFHDGVRTALQKAGMQWSSEYGAIYDDHPTGLFGVAQVPVHPVCPLLLLQAGLDRTAVQFYFEARVLEALRTGEAAVLYGHPIGDFDAVPGLFEHLRAALDEHAADAGAPVWQPRLGELRAFFAARRDQEVDCRWSQGRLHGRSTAPLRVEVPDGPARQVIGTIDAPCTVVPQPPGDVPGLARRRRRHFGERVLHLRRWLREVRRR